MLALEMETVSHMGGSCFAFTLAMKTPEQKGICLSYLKPKPLSQIRVFIGFMGIVNLAQLERNRAVGWANA